MSNLSQDQVLEIIGHSRLDDEVIAEIIATGATSAELLEALNRVYRGGEVGTETHHPMGATVAALCEILSTADEDWAEPDEH